jgi:hypothetical protein
MPSLMEIIDITILGTAIASLVISVMKLKKRRSTKRFENQKDLR